MLRKLFTYKTVFYKNVKDQSGPLRIDEEVDLTHLVFRNHRQRFMRRGPDAKARFNAWKATQPGAAEEDGRAAAARNATAKRKVERERRRSRKLRRTARQMVDYVGNDSESESDSRGNNSSSSSNYRSTSNSGNSCNSSSNSDNSGNNVGLSFLNNAYKDGTKKRGRGQGRA